MIAHAAEYFLYEHYMEEIFMAMKVDAWSHENFFHEILIELFSHSNITQLAKIGVGIMLLPLMKNSFSKTNVAALEAAVAFS